MLEIIEIDTKVFHRSLRGLMPVWQIASRLCLMSGSLTLGLAGAWLWSPWTTWPDRSTGLSISLTSSGEFTDGNFSR
ncbi:MAG: hypothetical protein AAF693_19875 [Bacteroidota bacterium]